MIKLHITLAPSNNPSRRRSRWGRIAVLGVTALALPVVATAASVDIPNAFSDGDAVVAEEFNENFDAIADAVTDNDTRITDVENAVAMSEVVPQGGVMFFDLDACPDGWTPMDALQGRVPVGLQDGGELGATVGADLGDQAQRTITQVPTHSHLVNPPATDSSPVPNHSHTMLDAGAHDHQIRGELAGNFGTYGVSTVLSSPGGTSTTLPILDAGEHSHTINPAGAHGHSLDITEFTSGSAGTASVDVTMPYVQLLACRRA